MSVETALFNRRDLLAPFAKKRKTETPPSRISKIGSKLTHPQPPKRGKEGISRRYFIGGGLVLTAGVASGILKPWDWFTSKPEQSKPESLESLITQAKKMEDEYKDQNLSNKAIREKFADLLAGIFSLHYPEYFSRKQLEETTSWSDTLDHFVRQRMASAGKTGIPTATQLENERGTSAMTDNRRRKITVNAAADVFQQRTIVASRNIPKGWNPLKMLCISLLHEFNHLVSESTDELIFSIIDPSNQYKDKRIEGFRFIGIDQAGGYAVSFNDLHESVVELLAKDISLSDFGSHLSDMPSETPGITMDVIINNLEQVLRVINMSHQELAKLHKSSNIREFLLILANKAGASSAIPLEDKIKFGSRIVRIILANDQGILQIYLNSVRSTNPSKN